MRLQVLSIEGLQPIQRIKMRLFQLVTGYIPSIFFALSYQRQLFGQPFISAFQEIMRKESEWSIGERELFAAFVSKLNACRY